MPVASYKQEVMVEDVCRVLEVMETKCATVPRVHEFIFVSSRLLHQRIQASHNNIRHGRNEQ